ncbi:MAG: hypothetical protein CMM49_00760 [Rhodospirillaceae bacterium]|nr:hypothetical protein [Rhodospirillaceae bacterium]|tara:strand:- start:1152 stop:2459 length:1308 start_codon:yes stop_codon:yes gene_type:complete
MKLIMFSVIIFSLAACEGRFSPKNFSPQGERISALSLDDSLKPDPNLVSQRVVLPKPIENKDWPQDGGSRKNYLQHIFMSDNPKLLWKNRIGKRSNKKNKLITNPIIYENRVFSINSKGYLIATNLKNGKHVWNLNLVPKGISDSISGGGLAADNGILYLITGFGFVYAINSTNGSVIWKKNISVPLRGSPTVGNGKVFFVSILNQTYALDKEDGNIIWVHSGVPETTSFLGGVSTALSGRILISPYSSGEVFALDSENGRVLWGKKLIKSRSRLSLVKLNDIHSRPIIEKETAYLSGSGGRLLAVDIRTGSNVWSRDFSIISSPWVSGKYIYFVTMDNQLICVEKNTGKIKWLNQLTVYKNNKKSSNKLLWSGPILVSDRLVLLSSLGVMIAISPYTGETLGKTKLSSEAFIEPIIAKGTMIVLTDDGILSAYK